VLIPGAAAYLISADEGFVQLKMILSTWDPPAFSAYCCSLSASTLCGKSMKRNVSLKYVVSPAVTNVGGRPGLSGLRDSFASFNIKLSLLTTRSASAQIFKKETYLHLTRRLTTTNECTKNEQTKTTFYCRSLH